MVVVHGTTDTQLGRSESLGVVVDRAWDRGGAEVQRNGKQVSTIMGRRR